MKNSTNGKIKDIVDDPLDPETVAILINAIYFNGDWKYPFEKANTVKRPFYLSDGTTKDVSLMSLRKKLAYMENENFQAVTLPYGDGEMSMKIFLPKEGISLDEFQKTLTNENWTAWNAEFNSTDGTILLPKFQVEYEIELNDSLKNLGMYSAFDERANFSKMIKETNSILISKVKQKTFIHVDEKGTEAAAVTSVTIAPTSAPINDPFHMEVNRPFFFAITDNESDTILFMGSISNPQEGK